MKRQGKASPTDREQVITRVREVIDFTKERNPESTSSHREKKEKKKQMRAEKN
jgi:hypothetical protein